MFALHDVGSLLLKQSRVDTLDQRIEAIQKFVFEDLTNDEMALAIEDVRSKIPPGALCEQRISELPKQKKVCSHFLDLYAANRLQETNLKCQLSRSMK